MPKRVNYGGQVHVFPDEATDDQIMQVLNQSMAGMSGPERQMARDMDVMGARIQRRSEQSMAPAPVNETPLSRDQEAAANSWANYMGMVRKNYGDRPVSVGGRDFVAAKDDYGLWKQAVEAAERSGWQGAPKAGWEAGVVAGLNDFSLGLSDEVASGLNAAGSFIANLPGKGLEGATKAAGETWDRSMDDQNFSLDQARQDQGGVTMATGIGASLIPFVGWGGRAVQGARAVGGAANAANNLTRGQQALRTTGNVGKTAAIGAGLGATHGVGTQRGSFLERVQEAGPLPAIMGAGGGVFGSMIGNVAGRVVKGVDDRVRPIFMSPENRAMFMIERAMRRDGVTIADLERAQRRVRAMGGNTLETLAELAAYSGVSTGKNLRGLARALHATPGSASEMAERLIQQRRNALYSGSSAAAAAGTGQNVRNYAQQLRDLEDQLQTQSRQAYDDFRASPVDPAIFSSRIVPILSTPPGRAAMQSAANGIRMQSAAAQSAGNQALARELSDAADALEINAAGQGGQMQMLSPRALDEVKRAFDDQIEAAGQRSYTGGMLRKAKNDFADHVSSATGGTYGNALGTFSEGKRLQEAIDAGYNVFNKRPFELEQLLNSGSGPGGILSQAEVEGVAFGFARALQDAIDSNNLSAVRKILRDRGMQNKLAQIMGANYPRFMSRITRMVNRQDFDNFVAGGSPTARIQAEVTDAADEDAVTRVLDSLGSQAGQGNVPNPVTAVASAIARPVANWAANKWRTLSRPGIRNERVNRELGEQMFRPMTNRAMNDFRGTLQARPGSRMDNVPDQMAQAGGYYVASTQGREASQANDPDQRASDLVDDYDGALLEEYLSPDTTPQRQRQIEAHFGPQAAELWRLRGQLSRNQ